MNTIYFDEGEINILGKNFIEYEIELKHEIGYAFGGVNYHTQCKIKKITNVVKKFYNSWDEETK